MSSLPLATLVKAILPPASAEGTATRVTIRTVEAISARTDAPRARGRRRPVHSSIVRRVPAAHPPDGGRRLTPRRTRSSRCCSGLTVALWRNRDNCVRLGLRFYVSRGVGFKPGLVAPAVVDHVL